MPAREGHERTGGLGACREEEQRCINPKNVLETLKGWVIYNSPGSWVFSPPLILLRMWRGQDSTSTTREVLGYRCP